MMEKDTETVLRVIGRALQFATDHPFAATGIFGAAVGSAVTYKVLTHTSVRDENIFSPKVYEFAVPPEELRQMLVDPTTELRWQLPGMVVVFTPEKRERLKELPDIVIKDENEGE